MFTHIILCYWKLIGNNNNDNMFLNRYIIIEKTRFRLRLSPYMRIYYYGTPIHVECLFIIGENKFHRSFGWFDIKIVFSRVSVPRRILLLNLFVFRHQEKSTVSVYLYAIYRYLQCYILFNDSAEFIFMPKNLIRYTNSSSL